MISLSQLDFIVPFATQSNLKKFLEPLNKTMERFEINTPLRQAAFIAQIAHESGSFQYVREIASGKAYEGRKDLGNTIEGDGIKFKGRGLIQITGRANYDSLSKAFGVDFISNPSLLEGAEFAAMSAGWFWNTKKLNSLADKGDFITITKRINGGVNGLKDRISFYDRAKLILL